MKFNTLRLLIIPLLFLFWIAILFNFNSYRVLIEYECCNEYKYLNNYAVILINALPFIIPSVGLILTILFIKINNNILLIELAVVIIFSLLSLLLMTIVFLADREDMLNQINNAFYSMITDFIYCAICILIILSATIKLIKYSIWVVKKSKV